MMHLTLLNFLKVELFFFYLQFVTYFHFNFLTSASLKKKKNFLTNAIMVKYD